MRPISGIRHLLGAINVIPGNISIEDLADGKTHVEREHVFYGRLRDFNQLSKATSKEKQEQWEIKLPKTENNIGSGGVRVRRTEIGESVEYTLTAKVRTEEEDAKLEATCPASEDLFNLFAMLAQSGMRKVRYNFPTKNTSGNEVVFEVDVFILDNGQYSPWCKIDVEVPNASTELPAFPIQFEGLIKQGSQNTEAERSLIRGLYDEVFLTKKRNLETPPKGV